MVRIQDIAKAAGVGVGTVSRMLKGNGYVSKDKRDKIQTAIDELGYVRKKKEEEQETQGMKLVGVVVPSISHPFFGNMVLYIETELQARGYQCMVISEQNILERQLDALRLLDEKKIDGLINFGNMPYGFEGRKDRPIVVFDRNWTRDVPLVRSDHAMGGRIVAEEFLRQGRKKVVQFVGGNDLERSANIRYKELKRIMEESGCEVVNIFMDWDMISYEYNRDVIVRYLDILKKADGCLANDIGAICCQNILRSAGMRIPEDIEIIAYDGTVLTNLAFPKLPVVQQDANALAKKLVEVLFCMIEGEELEEMLFEIPVMWKK